MIDRVKKILGIEGVKIYLDIPAGQTLDTNNINGVLELRTLSKRTITDIKLQVIETYARGRGKHRRINDFILGELEIKERIKLDKGESEIIDFDIPVFNMLSEMDRISNDNLLARPIVSAAKWFRKVKSTYIIKVDLKVLGTKLQPTYQQSLELKTK